MAYPKVSRADIFRSEYFSGVDIFQGWIFFRDEYFSGVNIFRVNIFLIWICPSEDSHSLVGLVNLYNYNFSFSQSKLCVYHGKVISYYLGRKMQNIVSSYVGSRCRSQGKPFTNRRLLPTTHIFVFFPAINVGFLLLLKQAFYHLQESKSHCNQQILISL